MVNSYQAFGLTFQSEVELFDPQQTDNRADVFIKYGRVPESIDNVTREGVRFQVSAKEFLFRVDGIAAYHVTDGTTITIEPAPGASPQDVRLFLLGSAIGSLLHQRNILPLHASAVKIKNHGVIFAGSAGSGKSTLAAAFHQRGCPLLADDICVVSAHSAAGSLIMPGLPQLKLWADTLKKLGHPTEQLQKVRFIADLEKFFLPVPERYEEPVPVSAVFILQYHNRDDFLVEPIRGMEKAEIILNNTYRHHYLVEAADRKTHFKKCASIANHASVVRICRPRKPFLLSELMQRVEASLA